VSWAGEFLRYLPHLLERGTIVLRRRSGALGDNLMLSMLAREVRRWRPELRIVIETDWPEFFLRNPNVDLVLRGKVAFSYVKPKYVIDGTPRPHMLDQLIRALPFEIPSWERRLEVFLSEDERPAFLDELQAGYFVVCPEGKGGHAANRKDWGFERFQTLVRSMPDRVFVQTGHKNQRLLEGAVDMRGLDVRATAFLLRQAEAAVLLEGGLMHLTNAVGGRAVIIYGGAHDPAVAGYPEFLSVAAPAACGPCFRSDRETGPCRTMECMARIRAELIRDLLVGRRYQTGGVLEVP
jgi:ADP-heptose:LPS heptosyltransferase